MTKLSKSAQSFHRDKTLSIKCGEVPEHETRSFLDQLKSALKNICDVK